MFSFLCYSGKEKEKLLIPAILNFSIFIQVNCIITCIG